ncbi:MULTISPECIES: hypothetical protein [Klebsiella/Raoultella group]|uniref:hypothetical protein n=1 Tax=Klebsiella/Raoultella group TaxID=2890311 RepID=UPI0023503630|nr:MULTISPECIES: hypothetical protein [Klebsiella/Raoultella group]MDC7944478.1 hypothetical protein [Raoultella ornithinolytica]HDO7157182.1 hypothetical protein [Klebsiella pneumoniae]HDU2983056.1 hypothetical protein [Klebsiella pneumoniae subsp. pneumoniae]
MSKQTGGPAFPVADGAAHRIAMQLAGDNEAKYIAESAKALAGMTLRDYFAAKAMQGWLASYPESEQHPVATHRENMVAELSYLMADAMLKAREE